jgi:type I restriction enzyme, S subunit
VSARVYERYKPGGTAWLPTLPSHWKTLAARRIFCQRRDQALAEDEQLSATQRYGVVPQRLFMEQAAQKVVLALTGTENFRHVDPDDFVISLRSFQGGIERSRYKGCVSPAYTVLRPAVRIDPDYFEQLLKCSALVSALQTTTDGIRDGKTISYGQFGGLALPVPPLDEQGRIAEFLADETAKIDALIAEQEKLIALLAEKRQATISRVVVKGLNGSAPMKNSGVGWLGAVPAHWKVAKLGRYARIENGTTPSRAAMEYWESGTIPWLASGEVNQLQITEASEFITKEALENCALRLLPIGTVVVGMIGQGKTRGMSAILRISATINQNLAAICPGPGVEGAYILYVLHAMYDWLREAGRGGNQAAMNCEMLSALRIPLPPMAEQAAIAGHIESEVAKLDSLRTEAESAIALLEERRAALITAAVTGQIDVRDAVPA